MSMALEAMGEVKATVGSLIWVDGWYSNTIATKLEAPDWYEEMAQFLMPSNRYDGIAYPVNIRITGRTAQRRSGTWMVRIEIEFVKDGEPNTFGGGWMEV